MIPGCAQQVEDGRAHGQRRGETVDEFACVSPDDLGAEEASALWLGENFYIAVVCLHQDRFAMIIERMTRREISGAIFLQLRFEPADGGELRIGEHDVEQQVIVEGLEALYSERMAPGQFSLGDCQVPDVVQA